MEYAGFLWTKIKKKRQKVSTKIKYTCRPIYYNFFFSFFPYQLWYLIGREPFQPG